MSSPYTGLTDGELKTLLGVEQTWLAAAKKVADPAKRRERVKEHTAIIKRVKAEQHYRKTVKG